MSTFAVAADVYGIDIEMYDSEVTSVYLFDGEEPALVDAGSAASAETILEGIADCGVDPADLEHLLLSHVHTDHTGAASALVDAAPDLDVYIHEATASHLLDPTSLVESSKRAMGEHFAGMGEQAPVPEENVVEVPPDGTTIDIGDHDLEMVYAPGHSPDHFAVWDDDRRILFAAECLGIYIPRTDGWLPPATLPDFDLETLEDTIGRLRALDPEEILFAHFGVWPNDPEDAFRLAETELRRFDERILDLHADSASIDETTRAVADELIDVSPPYDPRVEGFYSRLVTAGYLKYHGLV